MIRSAAANVVGRELLGVAGAVAGDRLSSAGGKSPLRKGEIAWLAVLADEVVLFKAKRGALRPKPTSEVIALAPRAAVHSARLEKGRLGAVLEVSLADGVVWEFDVPKVHRSGAEAVAAAIG
jgi:hypothetical protein